MVDKVYESPSIMSVNLQMQTLISTSTVTECDGGILGFGGGGGTCSIDNPRTKEEKFQDVDVWSEEW